MTEIQFLAQILLNDTVNLELKKTIVDRIIALEQTKLNPSLIPHIVNMPYVGSTECDHEYPMPWYATIPPNCKKCGKQATAWANASYTCGPADLLESRTK